jgi:hypothetical protein
MNITHLRSLDDKEFLRYCENIKIEDFGLVLNVAMERLRWILKYGCGDCTTCDDRAIQVDNSIMEKVERDYHAI